jgi:pilus assembly protein CpaE
VKRELIEQGGKLFQSIVISPNDNMRGPLASALQATGYVNMARMMSTYPDRIDLMRALRAHAVELVFIDFAAVDNAMELAGFLEQEAGHVQVAAFHEVLDPLVMQYSMRAGVREFLAPPFEQKAIVQALSRFKTLLERRPVVYATSNHVLSFLPSKAGSGTSTICLNTAAALARKPDTRTLLADFDLNSGMMRFMLKLNNKNSVLDAIDHSDEMDDNLWAPMVTSQNGMDVLHAGGVRPNTRIEATQIRNLVSFARRQYQALCFDLSGNLEKYSVELMHESKRIMLVCTPEIPSLHLTREKLAFLKECELADRVSIILNRVHKKAIFSKQQVEDLLGVPVAATFPNDYQGLSEASSEGTVVNRSSPMGKSSEEFANTLLDLKEPRPVRDRHKFLEHFSTASDLLRKSNALVKVGGRR